jgi:RNA polymerase sigma-70 factor (ECF subfamily)
MWRMADGAEPDEHLMARYAAGDVAAFDALYQRHELKVWRYLQRSVRNPATADELMQEVWFAVARQAHRYQPTARFTTWLFTLAHHRLIDNHRAAGSAHGPAAAAQGADPPLEHLADDPAREPMQRALADGDARAVIAALGQLPDEQREAFLLQAEAGQSVEEIAATTGVSFETAKSRLRYARAKLKELLREYA